VGRGRWSTTINGTKSFSGAAVLGGEEVRRHVGVCRRIDGARWEKGRSDGGRRGGGAAGHGWWMGWLEVGDELDRWVPPIGERVRGEGEVGRRGSVGPSAGGVLGLGEKIKGRERGRHGPTEEVGPSGLLWLQF
jgi:hypothetical protein